MNETDVKDALYDAVRRCCVHAIEAFPPEAIRDWRFGGHTLLHVAVIFDCYEAIPVLARYVDVNARNERGETALNIAARNGDAEAAVLLLDAGADPAAMNGCGGSAADWYGENAPVWCGETPLHAAVYGRYADVVELFLSRGADPNTRNADRETPLHVAALVGDAAIAALLIGRGADPNARDNSGRTPLHHAARRRRGAKAVRLLVESGAEVDARDYAGKTPLHVAAENLNVGAIKELLRAGADPTARDNEGLTPRDAAARRGHACIAEMLGPP
jgi:cytohesin